MRRQRLRRRASDTELAESIQAPAPGLTSKGDGACMRRARRDAHELSVKLNLRGEGAEPVSPVAKLSGVVLSPAPGIAIGGECARMRPPSRERGDGQGSGQVYRDR